MATKLKKIVSVSEITESADDSKSEFDVYQAASDEDHMENLIDRINQIDLENDGAHEFNHEEQ